MPASARAALVRMASPRLLGDEVLGESADRIKPRLVGGGEKILKRRQHPLSELRLAHGRKPPIRTEALDKPLHGGEYAIGLFNFGDRKNEMSLQFYDIGLPYGSGRALELYDCYSHQTIGTFTERYAAQIESHDCMMLRAKVVRR